MNEIVVEYGSDLLDLPGEWRMEAMRVLRAIRDDPHNPRGYRHKILENQPLMRGDLSGLHAVAFGSATDYYASFRVVYRVSFTRIEVIAIGTRTGSEVFKTARDRIYGKKQVDVRRARR